jgi:hypothetical protein
MRVLSQAAIESFGDGAPSVTFGLGWLLFGGFGFLLLLGILAYFSVDIFKRDRR